MNELDELYENLMTFENHLTDLINLNKEDTNKYYDIKFIGDKPFIYQRVVLFFVKRDGECEYINEYFEDNETTAVCEIKRKNESLKIIKLNLKDAEQAGLLKNNFKWKEYPKQMLQIRARSVALRDSFYDVIERILDYMK